MARPTSARSVASATPPIAPWPDTSLLCIAWRNRRVLLDITDGERTMRTSWMSQMKTMTGHQIPNAKYVGRCLKQRDTSILTWGHMGWHSSSQRDWTQPRSDDHPLEPFHLKQHCFKLIQFLKCCTHSAVCSVTVVMLYIHIVHIQYVYNIHSTQMCNTCPSHFTVFL